MSFYPLLAALITLVIAAIALRDWRWALLCVIPVGVAQDTFRKLTPDVPSYFILWSFAVFVLVMVVAVARGEMGRVRVLWLGDRHLRAAFYLYFGIVVIQCIHALLRWGSPFVPAAGAVFYFGPLVFIMLTVAFTRNPRWIRRFVLAYLWIIVPASLTVYLSYFLGDSVAALRDVGAFVGMELLIFDVGTVLLSYPGLFRVGEIAAFHAAVSMAFLSMLFFERDTALARRVFYVLLVLALLGATILTGRRKMLMAISFFWVIQIFLIVALRRGTTRVGTILLVAGLLVSLLLGWSVGDVPASAYLERGLSTFTDIDDRVTTSIDLFFSAINRGDGIGLGAGIASQALRYAGVDLSQYVGGAAESGIGYLVLELGIPGVVIVAWLGLQLARVILRRVISVARLDQDMVVPLASFSALMLSNLLTFAVATQLYGDYFVLIILGVVGGSLYSMLKSTQRKLLLAVRLRQLRSTDYQSPGVPAT